jgi:hypothetical protein
VMYKKKKGKRESFPSLSPAEKKKKNTTLQNANKQKGERQCPLRVETRESRDERSLHSRTERELRTLWTVAEGCKTPKTGLKKEERRPRFCCCARVKNKKRTFARNADKKRERPDQPKRNGGRVR